MIIGFTGHQRIDHPERWDWVRDQFSLVLRKLARPGDTVITSLAKGGDQLFSQMAIAEGLAINVVVPCVGYEGTFDDPKVLAQFEELLAQAVQVTTLAFPTPSEDAFLAAGLKMVERSDRVVTLWNGKEAAGKGGTGDIVAYAHKRGLPMTHIDPDGMRISGLAAGNQAEAK